MKVYQNLKYVDNLVEGKHQKHHLLIPGRLRCICLAQFLILYGGVPVSGRAGTTAMWVWGEQSVEFGCRPHYLTRCSLHKAVKQGKRGWQRESDTYFLPLIPIIHTCLRCLCPKTMGQPLFPPQ